MSDLDESYDGHDIVPAQSILRKLPRVIEPELALRLDAIVFASDALQYSFRKMQEAAIMSGIDGPAKSPEIGTALLVSAWDIVNQLDALRQLLNSLPYEGAGRAPVPVRLAEFLELAKILRNKMAHINQNLANRALASGRKSPIFGNLCYAWIDDLEADKCCVVSVFTGQVRKFSHLAVNPVGRVFSPPAGLFELSAFETKIELGPPLALLSKLLHSFAEQLDEQLSEQIDRLSKEHGVPVEELSGHPPRGLAIILTLKRKAI